VAAHPRGNHFKDSIIDAFYHGMAHRPDSTFGTVPMIQHSRIIEQRCGETRDLKEAKALLSEFIA
jgi:hypothetical protein